MNLPNLITLARLAIVPFVVLAILSRDWPLAFGLFLLAGLSDAVDGFIAKRFDMATELGAFIDPLADKALVISIYIALAYSEIVPRWLVVLVVFRDVIIIGGVLLASLMERPLTIKPLAISKINTFAQIAFAVFVLGGHAFLPSVEQAVLAGAWVVAGLTAASAGAYLMLWLKHMTDET
jgi:cardiolipin synthase (CMP-forming)